MTPKAMLLRALQTTGTHSIYAWVVQWIKHCPRRVAAGVQILLKAEFFSKTGYH